MAAPTYMPPAPSPGQPPSRLRQRPGRADAAPARGTTMARPLPFRLTRCRPSLTPPCPPGTAVRRSLTFISYYITYRTSRMCYRAVALPRASGQPAGMPGWPSSASPPRPAPSRPHQGRPDPALTIRPHYTDRRHLGHAAPPAKPGRPASHFTGPVPDLTINPDRRSGTPTSTGVQARCSACSWRQIPSARKPCLGQLAVPPE